MDNNQNFNQNQQNAAGQQFNQQQYDSQQQYYQQQYDVQQQYGGQQFNAQQQYAGQQYNAQQQQYNAQQQYGRQQYDVQQYDVQQQYYQQQNQYNNPSNFGNDAGNGGGNGGKKKTGLIIGIIVAVVVIAAAIIIAIVVKNKKSDKDDNKDKKTTEAVSTEVTERDTETTEESTDDVSETVTEEAKDVNHDPNNGEDYVPENPVIVDNEVFTVEIINIHHYNPEADDYEERSYRWDMKITNNRKNGGIEINAIDCEYNGIIIGQKELNPGDEIVPGESREVSFMWLDESDWLSDFSGFSDATSLKIYFTAVDPNFLFLIGENVEYYPYGEENVVSDLPDLSGLTPLIDYNGLKFYLTCFYTREEGGYESMPLKGFIINDSDVNYYLEDQWEDMTLNGVSTAGNYLTTYAGAHKVYYFQAWVDGTEEPVMASESNTIRMRYKFIECTRDESGLYTWGDEVYDSVFECNLPSYKLD